MRRDSSMGTGVKRTVRSLPANVFLMKIFSPLLLVVGIVGLFGDEPIGGNIVLILPLALLALFQLSLAQMELTGTTLRYRRFVKWHVLSRDDVVGSGIVWRGFVGFIRFNYYFRPFGRLYFILDEDSDPSLFGPGNYCFLGYLRGQPAPEQLRSNDLSPTRSRVTRLFVVGIFGALVSLFRIYLSGPVSAEPSDLPRFVQTALHLFRFVDNVWIAGAVVFVSGVLAVQARNSREASFFALVCGVLTPLIIWHGLTR